MFNRVPFTFSITAEDHAVVEAALAPRAGQHVVSICSAGDTPLNLLTHDVAQVTVIDRNPAQLFLAQLKAIGAAHLDLDRYRVLLGATPGPGPFGDGYEKIAPHLPPAARQFWDEHEFLLRRGVLWQGRVQQLLRAMRWVLRLALGYQGLRALRAIRTPADAETFLGRYLHSRRAMLPMRLILSARFVHTYYPQEGFRFLPRGQTTRAFVLKKIEDALRRTPIADNPYLHTFLFDAYPNMDDGPPYLRLDGHSMIKSRVDRLRWREGDISDVLGGLPKRSVDAFDLCNVIDWMDQPTFMTLMERTIDAARPSARILLFSRSGPVVLPPPLTARCHIERDISDYLGRIERTGYYASVNVLTVH